MTFRAFGGKWQEALAKPHVLDDEGKAVTAGGGPSRSCVSGEGLFVFSFISLPLGYCNGKQTVKRSWSGDGTITITVFMAW